MTAQTLIHTRAVLVWLNISTWSARKYDRQITLKVNSDLKASSDAGRYNKMLLPGDAASYKALVSLAGSIRQEHYSHTLAWSDEGWRLLPTDNFDQYSDWLRKRQQEFDAALDTFVSDYPALKLNAMSSLNSAYREDDYPDALDIRRRFSIGLNYMPVPAQGDIRVDLASDQVAMIESQIANKLTSSLDAAMKDAWSRLHEVTAHMIERLSDPKAIFRDSLITNAREVCDVLKRLNVTNDPDLEAMRVRVDRELAQYNPETLRVNKYVRQQAADKAQSILDAMKGAYGVAA